MGQSRKIYRKLVDIEEALAIVEQYVTLKPLGIEEVPVSESYGRILAEDVRANVNLPPFSRSLMDGYAVIAEDTSTAFEDSPVSLKVKARIFAGSKEKISIDHGEAVEVATGAPIPYPADAVVPVEYTDESNGVVKIYKRVAPCENIDILASDFVMGEIIAFKGSRITPSLVSALISGGVDEVKVFSRAKVAIVSIGDELKNVGEKRLDFGEVYDSNSHMIASLVKGIGAEPFILGIARDDEKAIRELLDEGLEKCDIVVTIGGTSSGLEDLTYRVIDSYKPGVIVHGLKIKPGGPTAIAIAGKKIVVALPGFPISCLTAATLVLVPIISKMQGMRLTENNKIKAILLVPVRGVIGKKRLIPVIISKREDKYLAFPYVFHSGSIGRFSKVDGYIIVPSDIEGISAGTEVEVNLYPGSRIADALYIGSHCPLAEKILTHLRKYYDIKIIYSGSMGGLRALKTGINDIAGTHLLDEKTNKYNLPFLEMLNLKDVIFVRGYGREQGFIYPRNLNIEIRNFEDIIDNNLRFINRNKGSGTRTLIEKMLWEVAAKRNVDYNVIVHSIKGYNFEVRTHDSVALAISQGLADVGVAIRYVAVKYGLMFTPIAVEEFDFVINKKSLSKRAVEYFVENIGQLIRENTRDMPGFILLQDSGEKLDIEK